MCDTMHRLSQGECARLLALAGDLYLSDDGAGWPQQLLRGLQSLIPHEFGGCHSLHPSRQEITTCYEPDRAPAPARHKDFWRLREKHPLNRMLFTHPAKAWKLTDAISHRAFLATEFYHALYRPLRVDQELVAVLPEHDRPGAFLLISLHRRGADFSERDRALLNLLLPHVARARQRLAERRNMRDPQRVLWHGEIGFCDWLRWHTSWGLTRRESQVLYWLCQGKTNSEIGSILGIAERTAETHASRFYPKMGVENRYTAMAMLNRLMFDGQQSSSTASSHNGAEVVSARGPEPVRLV